MDPLKKYQRLFLVLMILTLILVGLGAYVRTTGAGLSCPDWPLCHGEVVPDFTIIGVPQEVLHRYLATAVGLLTMFLVALSWRERKTYPRLIRYSAALLVLVIVQGIFGGLTVTMKLHPHVVATHLTLGTLFFQGVAAGFFQTMTERRNRPYEDAAPYRNLVLFAAFLTFVQIVWGGHVAASGAAAVCRDFPTCNGALIPQEWHGVVATQLIHRWLGFLLIAVFLALVVLARRGAPGLANRKAHLTGLFFVLLLQVVIGVGNIHMNIRPAMSVAHLVIAQLILLGIFNAYFGKNRSYRLYS